MILLYYIIDTGAFLDLVTAFPVDSATILRFSPAFGGGETCFVSQTEMELL